MQRNALDTCLSCFMEPLSPAHAPWSTSFENIALMFALHQRIVKHFAQYIDVRSLHVDYEVLVHEPDATSRRIVDFCGLPWDDRCLSFHETQRSAQTLSHAQVRKPMYTSSAGRAARFGTAIDGLRHALESHNVSCQSSADTEAKV